MGPGIIVMTGDNDVGAFALYTSAGALYGFNLLWVMLPLLPITYFAQEMVVRDLKAMQAQPVGEEELQRIKSLLLRRIPLGEASIDDIASGFMHRRELNLPLDEPLIAARRYIEMQPLEVQAAFKKWLRPDDLVRVTQGPAPR